MVTAGVGASPATHAHMSAYWSCGVVNKWGKCNNLRQISSTRTFLGRFATELGAARSVARHRKCSGSSLLKAAHVLQTAPSASACRGVILESGRQSYRVKVNGKFVARHKHEKEAAAHMAKLTKTSFKELRRGRRRPILRRLKTLLPLWSSVLPADLEDFVARYPTTVQCFSKEPALLVISAMWKFGPARDALAKAWRNEASPSRGGLTTGGLDDKARAAHLHHVLVAAVKILNGVDMAIRAANAGKSVTHHQGWLAWCQLRVPLIRPAKSGELVVGQQRRFCQFHGLVCSVANAIIATH